MSILALATDVHRFRLICLVQCTVTPLTDRESPWVVPDDNARHDQ